MKRGNEDGNEVFEAKMLKATLEDGESGRHLDFDASSDGNLKLFEVEMLHVEVEESGHHLIMMPHMMRMAICNYLKLFEIH